MSESEQNARQIRIKPIKLRNRPVLVEETSPVSDLQRNIEKLHLELNDLQKKKDRLIQETTEWITNEKTAWEEEKIQLIEQVKDDGYKDGFRIGEQAGAATYDSMIEKMNELTETAQKDYLKTIAQSDHKILEIAITAAGKILRQQLENHPEAYREMVQSCIEEVNDAQEVTIYVHPEQYDTLVQQKSELQKLLGENARLSIKFKKTIPEYGCILEHPFGQIDAGVDTQLSQIRHALREIRTDQ